MEPSQNWIDEKKLLECIHCGFCLPACPTHVISGEEMPSPRGRLYLMRAVAEGRLEATDPAFHEHEWSCLVCRACETACPSGVEFGYLMEQTRDLLQKQEGRKRAWIYTKLLTSRSKLNTIQRLTSVVTKLGLVPVVHAVGRALRTTFPKLSAAMRLMPSEVPMPRKRPDSYCATGPKRGTVGMLPGCIGDAFTARINNSTMRVLTSLGYNVKMLPSITCCGALQIHAGYREEALELARHAIREVNASGVSAYISNIAGCGAMLKDYATLFHHSEETMEFRNRVRDISEFLMEHHVPDFQKLRAQQSLKVGYQAACHLLHAQGLNSPFDLLQNVQGLEVVPLLENDLCCGSAGSYNIEHPEASEELLKRKIAAIEAAGVQLVVTANAGCLLQLQMGVRELMTREVRVLHVIEFIDLLMHELI